MLIIDEAAESKLTKILEDIRSQSAMSTARLIHFKLSELKRRVSEEGRKNIIASVQRYIPGNATQLYFCEDGDVIILVQGVAKKDIRQLIFDIAIKFHRPPTDEFAELYDLNAQVNKLLLLVEHKTEKRRKMVESAQKQKETEQTKRKHHAILNHGGAGEKTHDIAARRRQRGKPELMIIEDDAFSCRLVENVLQKQYPLTALSNAELAIATYVSKAPDVLFLDINLPNVTGHELLEKIISIDPEAYIIMLSGNSDQANIMQAMKNGAKGFIGKPFTSEKLFQYIDRCPTISEKSGMSAHA